MSGSIETQLIIPPLSDSDINRFWSKVAITANPDKCWEWQAGKRSHGYGRFNLTISKNRDKGFIASRIAYFIQNKKDPIGKVILHACDNTLCVNPNHLKEGTHKDNTQDMLKKGRGKKIPFFVKGESHPDAKLTTKKVLEIREKHSKGMNQFELSREYGVTQPCISRIVTHNTWNHI